MILDATSYTVTRHTAPANGLDVIDGTTGRPAALTTSTFTILAQAQPMDGEEREQLGYGERSREAWHVITETELRTVDESTGALADVVTIGGVPCEVVAVAHYNSVLPHYECACVRIEPEDPDA